MPRLQIDDLYHYTEWTPEGVPGKHQAFMVAINWNTPKDHMGPYEEFLMYLQKLAVDKKIGKTIIGKEQSSKSHKETDGYHIHVFTWMTDKTYHTITQTLFKKWKLRGRAEKDKPRQYGKVKGIRSLDKMIAYTIKGFNILTNYTEKDLKRYFDISYVKEEPVNDMKLRLLDHYATWENIPSLDDTGLFIVNYHRQQQLRVPTLSYIKSVHQSYQYEAKNQNQFIYSIQDIWTIIKLKL